MRGRRQEETNEQRLADSTLIVMLRLGELSAGQIAAELGVSLPIGYKRVRTLKARGYPVRSKKIRQGERGPKSTVYYLP